MSFQVVATAAKKKKKNKQIIASVLMVTVVIATLGTSTLIPKNSSLLPNNQTLIEHYILSVWGDIYFSKYHCKYQDQNLYFVKNYNNIIIIITVSVQLISFLIAVITHGSSKFSKYEVVFLWFYDKYNLQGIMFGDKESMVFLTAHI